MCSPYLVLIVIESPPVIVNDHLDLLETTDTVFRSASLDSVMSRLQVLLVLFTAASGDPEESATDLRISTRHKGFSCLEACSHRLTKSINTFFATVDINRIRMHAFLHVGLLPVHARPL